MTNYRIQMLIQKTVSVQTVELLRQNDEWIYKDFVIDWLIDGKWWGFPNFLYTQNVCKRFVKFFLIGFHVSHIIRWLFNTLFSNKNEDIFCFTNQ